MTDSSGLSGDKGVHSVGRPDLPTGTGPGLRIGKSERSGTVGGGMPDISGKPESEKDEGSE